MMSAQEAVSLYRMLEDAGIKIWLDGGWAVDALLGEETRAHEDLDIVIQKEDVLKMRELLNVRGYIKDIPRDDASEWNFVIGNDSGQQIDVHVIVLDEKGNGTYGPRENGEMYPAPSLTGEGIIGGQKVRCITAEQLVEFKKSYTAKEKNRQDIAKLREKFGL